jgi:hypothetical protein
MRRILQRFLIVLFLLSIMGCNLKERPRSIPNLDDFCQNIIEKIEYDDELVTPSQRAIDDMYSIDFLDVEEFAIYVSGTMATSNELVVLKLSDASFTAKAVKALETRIDEQKNNYRDYNPSEMFRLENAMIIKDGTYVLMSVSNDNETVKILFNEAFE